MRLKKLLNFFARARIFLRPLRRNFVKPHAAGRPQQQTERMRSERAEKSGRKAKTIDPAFVLRPLDMKNDL